MAPAAQKTTPKARRSAGRSEPRRRKAPRLQGGEQAMLWPVEACGPDFEPTPEDRASLAQPAKKRARVAAAELGLARVLHVPIGSDPAAASSPASSVVATSEVRVGTCSWADNTLVKESNWYPRKSMRADERLAYYASQFPVVEVDSTYYFPPTPELSTSWVERTPAGFTFDVKAWSLLTGHPTFPHSLWEDLQGEVRPEFRERRNLYDSHLPTAVLDECWARFRHSLLPLHDAGKLGGVLLQWPEWFSCNPENRERILDAVRRLDPLPCFVEFRRASWLDGEEVDRTLEFLEANDLTFVCVDEPQGFNSSMPPVVAATSSLAVIRFHGHNDENWERRGISAAERFRYSYDDDELRSWAPRVAELARSAERVHVLFNNCWQDFAVRNAASMVGLLTDLVGAGDGHTP